MVSSLESKEGVFLNNTLLPEFSGMHQVKQFMAHFVDTVPEWYGMIIGRQLMMAQLRLKLGFDILNVASQECCFLPNAIQVSLPLI